MHLNVCFPIVVKSPDFFPYFLFLLISSILDPPDLSNACEMPWHPNKDVSYWSVNQEPWLWTLSMDWGRWLNFQVVLSHSYLWERQCICFISAEFQKLWAREKLSEHRLFFRTLVKKTSLLPTHSKPRRGEVTHCCYFLVLFLLLSQLLISSRVFNFVSCPTPVTTAILSSACMLSVIRSAVFFKKCFLDCLKAGWSFEVTILWHCGG